MKLYHNNQEIPCDIIDYKVIDGGWSITLKPHNDVLFEMTLLSYDNREITFEPNGIGKYYIHEFYYNGLTRMVSFCLCRLPRGPDDG
jgi:hypothetical protein